MPIPFETGSLLEVRGERWLLTNAEAHGPCTVLTLEGRGRDNARQQLRVIAPFDRSRRITHTRPSRRPRRAVLRAALGAIVDRRSAMGLWTAANSSIDLLAYQLEPALAAIGGATRLLLADAVGLGKTIQAALLLSELRERGWVSRALIVCPAGLRDTWERELRERFGIHAVVMDHAAIAGRIASLPPGASPWAGHGVAIASVDFLKRAEVLAAIEQQPLDLLIADEAHHLAPGTDRGAAISRLASRAPWCVLLSATPHSGDAAAFSYLTSIGARGESITVFRRSRSDVGLATARRTHVLPVTPSAEEAALFAALDRYTRAIWRERGRHDQAVRLIAVTLSRRAASSAPAIERTLTRRLALLTAPDTEATQPLLPWEDQDEGDQDDSDAVLKAPGLDNRSEERACLEQLIELARRCVPGSKLRRLRRLLDSLHEPVVIFTEYRDSLDAIVDALTTCRRVAAIHGGVPSDLRRSIVDAFNSGALDVLVATDAAGEGLNLHHRCRLVVDLELPWNPVRLEQRVGRVDRLGQHRTVHAIRLFHGGGIEQRVLDHLRLRDRRAQEALQHHVTDAMIANAIFDGAPLEAVVPVAIGGTRIDAAAAEAARLDAQRRAHDGGARSGNGLSWAAPRNGRSVNLVVLTRRSFVNESGVLLHEEVAVRVLALRPLRTRRQCRRLIEHQRAQSIATHAVVFPVDDLDSAGARLRRRIAAINADAGNPAAQQSSLFDRRAEAALTMTQASMRRRDQALTRLLLAIAPPAPERTRVELIAAWPATRR